MWALSFLRHHPEAYLRTPAQRCVSEFDELPPVDAFWSLTLYGPDRFFVENPDRVYAVRHPGDLVFGDDGSLELAIGTERPADVPEANWLPAPPGPFSLMLRLYLPDAAVVADGWRPPPLEAVDAG